MKTKLAKIEPKPLSPPMLLINPYGNDEYRFDVGMPLDQLVQKLKADAAPMFSLDLMMRSKPFYGSIDNDSFKITWLKYYHNSWAPVAIGRMMVMGNRTRVDISFRMHLLVMPFILIWMIGAIGFAIFALVDNLAREQLGSFVLIFPFFGLGLTSIGALIGRRDQASILNYFNELPDTTYVEQTKLIE